MVFNDVYYYSVAEDKNATYFAGSSFKVKNDVLTIEWDKYGNCTKIDGKFKSSEKSTITYTGSLTASYTYETVK